MVVPGVVRADGSPAAPPAAPASSPRAGRAAALSSTRAALANRSVELAKLDVLYLRRDLRNVAIIAGLMLAVIIALSFVLR